MTVIEMVYRELTDFREEAGKKLDDLNEKVAIQNGRVRKLEAATENKEKGIRWIVTQSWFPWLCVFVITEIGPKAIPAMLANLAAIFKH